MDLSGSNLRARVEERVREWGVVLQDTLETQSSFIGFGLRGKQPVVLKVLRQPGDEWQSGKVLERFDGHGMVRVYEHIDGAVLLERLNPGKQLASLALDGRDDEAIDILSDVIGRMLHPRELLETFVTVRNWGKGFEDYLTNGDNQIPKDLVEQAQHLYTGLCASQRGTTLLHGDLQHYNVLLDSDRGWIAIDPKGVVGEIEYEIGAALRNPHEKPDLFARSEIVERRLAHYGRRLNLDLERALSWAFAQAVLSAVWSVEDGFAVNTDNPAIMLANAIRPILN